MAIPSPKTFIRVRPETRAKIEAAATADRRTLAETVDVMADAYATFQHAHDPSRVGATAVHARTRSSPPGRGGTAQSNASIRSRSKRPRAA